jgi:DNA ligase-associated metallophosphoesterase
MFDVRSVPGAASHGGFAFASARLLADASGALVWPDAATVIVADLHFEKASSYARHGAMLPPYDTAATLARLADVVARHRARRVVCLGDSFHDEAGPARLAAADAHRLAALVQAHEWLWVAGNHDPILPAWLGGRLVAGEVVLGPLILRHKAAATAGEGEISGHYHPKASVATRAGTVTGRCFVTDGRRLVLPAFGALAGGLDVFAPPIAGLFPAGFDLYVIGRRRVVAFPARRAA